MLLPALMVNGRDEVVRVIAHNYTTRYFESRKGILHPNEVSKVETISGQIKDVKSYWLSELKVRKLEGTRLTFGSNRYHWTVALPESWLTQ